MTAVAVSVKCFLSPEYTIVSMLALLSNLPDKFGESFLFSSGCRTKKNGLFRSRNVYDDIIFFTDKQSRRWKKCSTKPRSQIGRKTQVFVASGESAYKAKIELRKHHPPSEYRSPQ